MFSNEHEKAAAPKADEKADVKPSILENTVIVKKEDESVNLNYKGGYRPRVNPIPGGGGYYYLPCNFNYYIITPKIVNFKHVAFFQLPKAASSSSTTLTRI